MKKEEIVKKALGNPPRENDLAYNCIQRIVHDQVLKVVASVKNAMYAEEQYSSSPSIYTGAMRSDAKTEAKKSIEGASIVIWETWAQDYKTDVTEYELLDIISTQLEAFATKIDDGEWKDEIAKELTTRRA